MKQLHHGSGKGSVGRKLQLYLVAGLAGLALTGPLAAALIITTNGTGVQIFETPPGATNWATLSIGTSEASVTSAAQLDAAVNLLVAANINLAVDVDVTTPPASASLARWNLPGQFLFTRPTGNDYTVLMAVLQNAIGTNANSITVTYDFNVTSAGTGEVPGWRVYYSLTGNAGDWRIIPALSDNETPGAVSNTVSLASSWPNGSTLYLLWADDNATGLTDPAYSLDNFSVSASPASPIVITNQPQSVTVPEGGSATFTVGARGTPKNYQWYRGAAPIAGATQASYTNPPAAFPGDNGAQFHVVISNAFNVVTSAVATLTVTNTPVTPIVITNQPQNITVVEGGSATFTVGASGSPKYYQWYRGGAPISGANLASYTLSPAAYPGDNGAQFRVVVSNSISVVTSAVATLTVIQSLNGLVVTPSGTGVQTFETLPGVTNWATLSVAGGGATVASPGDLDNAVNTVAAAGINMALGTDAGATPGTAAIARWNSAGRFLQTRPTGVAYTLLMVTLQNGIGDSADSLTITYDFNVSSPATGEVPGFGVYYNLTGAAGDWQLIPGLSGSETPATVSANVPLSTPWPSGSTMYLLWADDNANGITDPAYTIDNFSVTASPATTTPIVITNQPQSLTVAERDAATFTVGASGAPQNYYWYRGGAPIVGANQGSYTIPSAIYPDDNGAQFRVVISNSSSVVTSAVATLTVRPDTNGPTVVSVIGRLEADTVIVTFSEALDPAAAGEPGNYIVYPTGSNPFGAEALTTHAITFSNASTVILQTDPRTAGVNYSIRLASMADASSQNNVLNPDPTIIPYIQQDVQLVGFDANNEWKYEDSGTDLTGTGWEAVGYNDSAWLSGPAALGFDANPNAVPNRTAVNYVSGKIVYYFRRHFTVPASVDGGNVTLTLQDMVDDGAVYYLNGQEAFRHRIGPGPVDGTTLAVLAPDPTPIEGPYDLPTTNVFAGDNVIAVEVHQTTAGSSDIDFAAALIARVRQFGSVATPPALHISQDGEGQVTIRWTGGAGDVLQETAVLDGASTVWANSSRLNGVPFTPGAGQANRFYRLCNNCGG